MTKEELRALSEKSRKVKLAKCLEEIQAGILAAAEEGEFEFSYTIRKLPAQDVILMVRQAHPDLEVFPLPGLILGPHSIQICWR